MGVPINYWAVLVVAVIQFIIGALWYGPVFGKTWMKLMGMNRENMPKPSKGDMNTRMLISFVGSLLVAYVLAHALVFAATYTETSGASAGLMVGFWNWLGFIAPVTVGSVLWEGRSWKLWCFNNAYWLVSLLVMGTILAVWA